jgi:hypothetical protein
MKKFQGIVFVVLLIWLVFNIMVNDHARATFFAVLAGIVLVEIIGADIIERLERIKSENLVQLPWIPAETLPEHMKVVYATDGKVIREAFCYVWGADMSKQGWYLEASDKFIRFPGVKAWMETQNRPKNWRIGDD